MSKICIIWATPQSERWKYVRKLIDQMKKSGAVRPDTEFEIIASDKPNVSAMAYADTFYFDLLSRTYTIDAVVQAEKKGYDAAVLGCWFDPGLDEAREIVDIPVVGAAEASLSLAIMLGRKKASTAVFAVTRKGVLKSLDVIDRYGFSSQMIAKEPVRYVPLELLFKASVSNKASDIQAVKDESIRVARECIKDGAEIIINGCAALGPFLATEGVTEVDGVPIVDCLTCGIVVAQSLIDMQKVGVSVSRHLMYRKPAAEDWKKERAHFGFKC